MLVHSKYFSKNYFLVIFPIIFWLMWKNTFELKLILFILISDPFFFSTVFCYKCDCISQFSIYILDGISLFDRFVVPMKNGDLDSKGPLASIVQSEGTIESFKVRFLPVM